MFIYVPIGTYNKIIFDRCLYVKDKGENLLLAYINVIEPKTMFQNWLKLSFQYTDIVLKVIMLLKRENNSY